MIQPHAAKNPKDNLSGVKRLDDIFVNSQLEAKCFIVP
ncbi:hypothetical protein UNSWDHB_1184 [Dehalobacter sp. UNSWDHB]|nr:hypothetical protein DHBDCA_p2330 [Dehalobacter sp. DCA]AFV06344.1 hypothetical protein DCF50_p2341 [Dehalobacter sp. CF]EQB21527.1 hypothetical protein UNSWDHB_1184 [Dehalobacter sp. UNSWDHB]